MLLLLALLGGCQYLPAAPKPDHVPANSPLLQLPSASAGVLVLPVAGAPTPLPLAAAMADALRDADVAADTESSNRRSLRLQGSVEVSPARAGAHLVRWRVTRADGSLVGETVQSVELPARDWAAPSPEILAGLAHTEAPALAALLQDPAPRERTQVAPTILLYPVAGAPGDGQRSLTTALGRALAQAHVTVIDPTGPAGAKAPPAPPEALAIAGSVSVGAPQGPPQARQQHVKITWSVLDQNGTTLGSIDQENDVPAGTLDGAWGEVAPVVAEAALDGIVPLLDRLMQRPPS